MILLERIELTWGNTQIMISSKTWDGSANPWGDQSQYEDQGGGNLGNVCDGNRGVITEEQSLVFFN